MLCFLWRASRGYRLRPCPYLCWRSETYPGVPAETVSFPIFWKFVRAHRRELLWYLRWVDRSAQAGRKHECVRM